MNKQKDFLYQRQGLDNQDANAIFESALRSVSTRAFNAIIACGIRDLEGFLSVSESQLKMVKGVGIETVQEILRIRDQIKQKQQVYKPSCERAKDKYLQRQFTPDKKPQANETYKSILINSSTRIPHEFLNKLSNRAVNILRRQGIDTVEQFLSLNEQRLKSFPGVGYKTLKELLNFQKQLIRIYSYPSTLHEPTRMGGYKRSNHATAAVVHPDKKGIGITKSREKTLEVPAVWSILRKSPHELYDRIKIDRVKFYERTEGIRLSELNLPAQDLWRLRAVALFPEDTLTDIGSLTWGYIVEIGLSDEAFSILLQGLSKVFNNSLGIHFEAEKINGSPIICDSEVKGIANLPLGAFKVPQTIVTLLESLRIKTWRDTVGLSERDIIKKLGLSAQSFRCIHYLWLLKRHTEEVRLKMPEEIYSSFETLINYYVELGANTSREKTILKGRMGLLDGRQWTLEELGNIEGITRERVRQIEKKCIKKLQHAINKSKLQPLWEATSGILARSGGICLGCELAKFLANLWSWPSVPAGERIAALLSVSKGLQVTKEPRLSIMMEAYPCLNCLKAEQILIKAVEEAQGILTVQEAAEILSESCKLECRVAISEKIHFSYGFLLYVAERSDIIKTDGNCLYNQKAWVCRYGRRNEMIEAIMQNCNRAMHFTEVYQKMRELRPDDKTLSERYVHACMSNSPVLLLWDRGTFIHRSHVVIPHGLIHDIEIFILKRLNRGVPYISISGVFMGFKEKLIKSGIPTESALYSCLREVGNTALVYPEYPYVMLRQNRLQRLPLPFVLEQFVRDQEGVVSLDKIRDYLIGKLCVSQQLQGLYIYNIPNVIQVDKKHFIHVDELNIDRGRMRPILDHIDTLLENTNHVAVTKVFAEKRITCKLLGILNPVMLYSILKLYCSEHYDLPKYPSIYISGKVEGEKPKGIYSEIAAYIRKKNTPCSYDELFHYFVDELGYKQETVYNIRYQDEVVYYSQGTVVHLATLCWTDEKQKILEQIATTHYSERERAGKPFGLIKHLYEFARLPELPACAPWTITLLGELLSRHGHFIIIGTQRNAFVPESNTRGIKSLSDLLYIILKEYYGGAANISVFEKDMQEAGILQKSLTPMMLGEESLVTIKGNTVVLTELC